MYPYRRPRAAVARAASHAFSGDHMLYGCGAQLGILARHCHRPRHGAAWLAPAAHTCP
jgi:hypothetical protein